MKLSTRRVLAALAIGAATSLPAAARAEGDRILFVAPLTSAFSARVRAEIEAMGFTVEPAPALSEEGPPTAIAAARVIEVPPPRRVELWIVDASSGLLALRAVISTDEGDDIQTARASEQLRAFFQPLRDPPPPPAPPAPSLPALPAQSPYAAPAARIAAPLPATLEPPPASGPRFDAGAAVSVPLQVGGAGVDLTVRARWMATRVVGVGAVVSVPIAGSTVASTQGSASVTALISGAELSAVVFESRVVRFSASAGCAVAWLRTVGTANAPYVGHSESVVTGLPLAGFEVAPRLVDRVHLTLDGHAAVSAPRADIVFAGHTVATWARPLGLLSAGMSVDF
jgi:hypothetical protein